MLAAVVIAAVAWATALSPGLLFSTALVAVVLLAMSVAVGWMLASISEFVSRRYKAMTETILSNRKDFLSAKRRERGVHGIGGLVDDLRSFLLFFLVFLFYFSVMIVFFYGLGGQLLSDPSRLMVAAFLGTSILHFSGHAEGEGARKVVLDFLVPFGIIVGLIDVTVIGLYTLLSLAILHGPVALLFFGAYYSLDFVVEWRRGRGRQQGFVESQAPGEKPGGSEETGRKAEMPDTRV